MGRQKKGPSKGPFYAIGVARGSLPGVVGLNSLFKWVTAAISGGNRSMGATSTVSLPPPPPEIQIVL